MVRDGEIEVTICGSLKQRKSMSAKRSIFFDDLVEQEFTKRNELPDFLGTGTTGDTSESGTHMHVN